MNRRSIAFATIALLAAGVNASAHFSFIIPSNNGASARLIMSETLVPEDEVKVDILKDAKLSTKSVASGADTPVTLQKNANENALDIPLTGEGTRVVHGKVDLGIMQRGNAPANLLVYFPKAIVGDAFDAGATIGQKDAPIELAPIKDGDGFKLQLLIDGKPASADQALHVIMPDGTQDEFKTDDMGQTDTFEKAGRYGIWARHWIDAPGSREGKDYKQVRQYATLVFDFKTEATKTADASGAANHAMPAKATTAPAVSDAKPFGTMVEKAASFGAVAADGYLYTYGGHIVDRHSYSVDGVSGKFNRLKLSDPTKWEELPAGPHVQGMNLAALDGKIYRIGGMQPRNKEGDPDDNHSLAEVARFDPAKKDWERLADLPVARSSHDIAFIGHNLYVVGGWNMKGTDKPSDWINNMAVLDLDAPAPEWKTVDQPFSRRALIAAVHNGKLFVMGGFDEDDNPHLDVDIFDPKTNAWTKGPAIPGQPMNGFSPAACVVDNKLVLSVGTGEVFQLSGDGSAWTPIAHNKPRIVHRLVPFGSQVLIVGGAMNAKMTNLIESIDLEPKSVSSR